MCLYLKYCWLAGCYCASLSVSFPMRRRRRRRRRGSKTINANFCYFPSKNYWQFHPTYVIYYHYPICYRIISAQAVAAVAAAEDSEPFHERNRSSNSIRKDYNMECTSGRIDSDRSGGDTDVPLTPHRFSCAFSSLHFFALSCSWKLDDGTRKYRLISTRSRPIDISCDRSRRMCPT